MISVLTCTYNRGRLLPVLYKSLASQTVYDFEWILVDDGSQDDTPQLVESFIEQEKKFKILYYRQPNGGKHTAINEGMKHVSGSWVFIVDSDDELTHDAIETADSWIADLEKNPEFNRFAGVSGLRMTRKGVIIGGNPQIGGQYVDMNSNERKKKQHLSGDKAEIWRTDILKKYPFPAFENEKFLSERAVWNKIALDGYRIRYYPKAIYICEYLEGGLSRTRDKEINNFNGFTYEANICIQASKGAYRLRWIRWYIRFAKIKGYSRKEILSKINISNGEYYMSYIVTLLYCIIKRTNRSVP